MFLLTKLLTSETIFERKKLMFLDEQKIFDLGGR